MSADTTPTTLPPDSVRGHIANARMALDTLGDETELRPECSTLLRRAIARLDAALALIDSGDPERESEHLRAMIAECVQAIGTLAGDVEALRRSQHETGRLVRDVIAKFEPRLDALEESMAGLIGQVGTLSQQLYGHRGETCARLAGRRANMGGTEYDR